MRRGNYSRLPETDGDDEDFVEFLGSSEKDTLERKRIPGTQFVPEQFRWYDRPIPWKAIAYACFLFVAGTILLVCGCLIHIGHVDKKYDDRLWPLIIFGSLMFIPGSYHVYAAVQAYLEAPGYYFEDFPQFD